MRIQQALFGTLVLALGMSTANAALARDDGRSESAASRAEERPSEVRLGHELGLPDVTLRRHPLGSYGVTLMSYPGSRPDLARLRGELLVGGGPAVRQSREALELPVGFALSLRLRPELELTGELAARAALHPDAAERDADPASLEWFGWLGLAVHL